MGGKNKRRKNLPAQGSSDPPGSGGKGGVPGALPSSSSDGPGKAVGTGHLPGCSTDLRKIRDVIGEWREMSVSERQERTLYMSLLTDEMDKLIIEEYEREASEVKDISEFIKDRHIKDKITVFEEKARRAVECYRTLLEDQKINETLAADLSLQLQQQLDANNRREKPLLVNRGTNPIKVPLSINRSGKEWEYMNDELQAWKTGNQLKPVEKIFHKAMEAFRKMFSELEKMEDDCIKAPQIFCITAYDKIRSCKDLATLMGDGVVELAGRLVNTQEDRVSKCDVGLDPCYIGINKGTDTIYTGKDAGNDPIRLVKDVGVDPIYLGIDMGTSPIYTGEDKGTSPIYKEEDIQDGDLATWMRKIESRIDGITRRLESTEEKHSKKARRERSTIRRARRMEEMGYKSQTSSVEEPANNRGTLDGSKGRKEKSLTIGGTRKIEGEDSGMEGTGTGRGTGSAEGEEDRIWSKKVGKGGLGKELGARVREERKQAQSPTATSGEEGMRGRCYRCLRVGHTWRRCTSPVDRGTRCYRCGVSSHIARGCRAGLCCPLCADMRRPAGHRLGGDGCINAPLEEGREPGRGSGGVPSVKRPRWRPPNGNGRVLT